MVDGIGEEEIRMGFMKKCLDFLARSTPPLTAPLYLYH
jgi:hypothetical protein